MQGIYSLRKLSKLTNLKMSHTSSSMNDMIRDIRNIYEYSVRAVQPGELIRKAIRKQSKNIEIQGKQFLINRNVHVVGFGKAVLGMAVALENILQDHIISGILSVPFGMTNENLRSNLKSSRIEVFEGAQNNIPDNNSLFAANKISKLVASLGESSVLFVLISGGGSALLPAPKFPLTLEEKQNVIKTLASVGATIEEINIVRKKLSLLKGGGLAQLTNPAQVISLILSDIIGDPLGLIASGPTVENTDDPDLALSIIEKYKIREVLPQSALQLLDVNQTESNLPESFEFVSNFIIGNNTLALNAAVEKARELQYKSVIMTNKLCGFASDIGQKIMQLVDAALQQEYDKVTHICEELNINKDKGFEMLDNVRELEKSKGLCILFGGETTVEVKGKGVGGRNQELALAASLELNNKKPKKTVILLSAGTDGIDGPTDAAGALATPFVIDMANNEKINAQSFLCNNNSYKFYNSLCNGLYHIKIGHTGTNVMDIIIVLIENTEY